MISSALKNLLDAIGKGEAPKGYGQIYGGARGVPKGADVSKMTLNAVEALQATMVKNGSESTACGRYQFIRKTLLATVSEMRLTGKEVWRPELQDRMALHLIEKRGLGSFLAGKISREQFANNLAAEWASLPMVSGPKKGRSRYAGDGLNKSFHSVAEMLALLDALRAESPTRRALQYDPQVETVQRQLAALGYALGDIDGKAGSMTTGAIAAFQKDNGLAVTGTIDAKLLAALKDDPKPRPISTERATATAEDLRAKGSETILTADNVKMAGGVAGAAGAFGAANQTTDAATGSSLVDKAQDYLGIANVFHDIVSGFSDLLSWAIGSFWWVAAAAAGLFAVVWGRKIIKAKVEGYRKGEDIESTAPTIVHDVPE